MIKQTSRIIALVAIGGALAALTGCVVPSRNIPVPVNGTVHGGSYGKNDCDVTSLAYVTFPDSGSPTYQPNPTSAKTGILWLAAPYNDPSKYKIQWTANMYPYSACCKGTSSNAYYFNLSNVGNSSQKFMFTVFFTKGPVPPSQSQVTLNVLWQ